MSLRTGDEVNETSSMDSRPSFPTLTGSRRDDDDSDDDDGEGFLEDDPSQPDTLSIVNGWTNSSAMSSSAANEDSQASASSTQGDTRGGDYGWKVQKPKSSRYKPPTSSEPSKWAKTRVCLSENLVFINSNHLFFRPGARPDSRCPKNAHPRAIRGRGRRRPA